MSPKQPLRLLAVALLTGALSMPLRGQGMDAQPVREGTIQPETRALLTLQSRIHSKLSEAGDNITATLAEPIYVDGELLLARGTEFHGRIVAIKPAKRGQRRSSMSITFENVTTPSGSRPIEAQVTAIDDWDKEETVKADEQGKMKGGRDGERTLDNMRRGSGLGVMVGILGAILGGAAGAGARQALGIGGIGMATGMIGGVVLTKGNETRATAGSTLRIKFLKPSTLPILQQPTTTGN